jgi:flagellar basal body-associated protein FliL
MKTRFTIVAFVLSLATAGVAIAAEQKKPEPAKTEAKAEAKAEAKPEVKAAEATTVNKVVYKGRSGVQAFLEAAANNKLPSPADVEVEAAAPEVLDGSLDAIANAVADNAGRKTVSKALILSVAGIAEVDEDVKAAWAETVQATYEGHVVAANGVDEVAVPAWTDAVLTRATKKDESKVNEAVTAHAEAERRIHRLRNPSWTDSFVYWWCRD